MTRYVLNNIRTGTSYSLPVSRRTTAKSDRACASPLRASPVTDPPESAGGNFRWALARLNAGVCEESLPCCAETPGNIRPDKRATDGSSRRRSRLPPPASGSTSDHATAGRYGRSVRASSRRRVPRIRGAAGWRWTCPDGRAPPLERCSGSARCIPWHASRTPCRYALGRAGDGYRFSANTGHSGFNEPVHRGEIVGLYGEFFTYSGVPIEEILSNCPSNFA